MAETLLSTLLLMLIFSCYFIHNTRRDTESDIVIRTTLEHVLVQKFKKKEMDEKKKLLTKTCKCCKASKFLQKNDLA